MPTPADTATAAIEINSIHSFLIRPGKGVADSNDINGAVVPKSKKLFDMLRPIFDGAEQECKHRIAFNPENGKQENGCRDVLVAYINNRR
jgi:hypothetical protein